MWKRIFEMQSRIEAIVALCVPALRKVEKQFADAFLHDDLLVKPIVSALKIKSRPIWMASGILT